MAKVILIQDQLYISNKNDIKAGKKNSLVDVDDKFLVLIKGKYKPYKEEEQQQEPIIEKPLEKMNKSELVKEAIKNGIKLSDEEFESLTKAKIIELLTTKW